MSNETEANVSHVSAHPAQDNPAHDNRTQDSSQVNTKTINLVETKNLDNAMHSTAAEDTPRLGVALGGGSARGYAHIGALMSLETHGLSPAMLVGTSFGAIVGALYAVGKPLEELVAFATEQKSYDVVAQLFDVGLHKAALMKGDKLEQYLDIMFEGRHFSDLARPFAVVATDVDTNERLIIDQGPLAPVLRASASIPGIFAPAEVNGRRLIDGGIGVPVPVTSLESYDVDVALGIEVGMRIQDSPTIQLMTQLLSTPLGSRLHQEMHNAKGGDAISVLSRTLACTFTSWQDDREIPTGTLNIHTEPPINWLNFHRAEEAIAAGKQALDGYIPDIQQALHKATARK